MSSFIYISNFLVHSRQVNTPSLNYDAFVSEEIKHIQNSCGPLTSKPKMNLWVHIAKEFVSEQIIYIFLGSHDVLEETWNTVTQVKGK